MPEDGSDKGQTERGGLAGGVCLGSGGWIRQDVPIIGVCFCVSVKVVVFVRVYVAGFTVLAGWGFGFRTVMARCCTVTQDMSAHVVHLPMRRSP